MEPFMTYSLISGVIKTGKVWLPFTWENIRNITKEVKCYIIDSNDFCTIMGTFKRHPIGLWTCGNCLACFIPTRINLL